MHVPTVRLWREDRQGAVSLATPAGAGLGAEESRYCRQPSGLGDLVQRHEPHVPKGPSRHLAIRPDDQVGDAAVAKR